MIKSISVILLLFSSAVYSQPIVIDCLPFKSYDKRNIESFEGFPSDGLDDSNSFIQSATYGVSDLTIGTFNISSPITIQSDYSVFGCGQDVTTIQGDLIINASDVDDKITLKDFTINGDIRVVYNQPTSWSDRTVSIADVSVNGSIYLYDAWHSNIENVFVRGNSNTVVQPYGIHIDGMSVDVKIDRANIMFADIGLLKTGGTEGLKVKDSQFVFLNKGIVNDTPSNEPDITITGCHFNCFDRGVESENANSGVVNGCLFFKRSGSTSNYIDINLITGSRWRVYGNEFVNNGTSGTDISLNVIDGDQNYYTMNVVRGRENIVTFGANTSDSGYKCNLINPSGTFTESIDNGTNNIVINGF